MSGEGRCQKEVWYQGQVRVSEGDEVSRVGDVVVLGQAKVL